MFRKWLQAAALMTGAFVGMSSWADAVATERDTVRPTGKTASQKAAVAPSSEPMPVSRAA